MKVLVRILVIAAVMTLLLRMCAPANGEFPGHEYMPDMAHPVSYEANTYSAYSYNHWDEESTFDKKELSQPRLPIKGTVPRGMTAVMYEGGGALATVKGKNASTAISAQPNGYAPFYYGNSEEERTRAMAEITTNPFNPTYREGVFLARIADLKSSLTVVGADQAAITKQIESAEAELKAETTKVMALGKQLYDIQCGICHGEKGDGAGYLARDGGPYPVAPANFKSDEFLNASEGRYYYAIMYGKNVMGAYADKLSFEERWLVIRHIRSLQK